MENCQLSAIELYHALSQELPGFAEWTEREIVEIKRLLRSDIAVLDIGCGWGRQIRNLAPFCKTIVGVDIDCQEIKQARSYLKNIPNTQLFLERVMHF